MFVLSFYCFQPANSLALRYMARSNQTDANNVGTHTEATSIPKVTDKSDPIKIGKLEEEEKSERKKNTFHCSNF